MDRRHLWLLAAAAAVVVVLHMVFRVRVMLAGGKFLIALAIIIAITIVVWPSPRDR